MNHRAEVPLHAGIRDRARERAEAVLADDFSTGGAVAAGQEAGRWADERITVQLARDRPRLDCKKGCAWCCHVQVAARPPEVLAVADFVSRRFTPAQRSALAERARVAAEQARGLDWLEHERLRMPCPLLEEGACSVYEARPLACRGFNSTSARRCQADFEDPPREVTVYAPLLTVTASIGAGVGAALDGMALDGAKLSLPVALDIALSDPDAGERWLSGEPVFAPALLPGSRD